MYRYNSAYEHSSTQYDYHQEAGRVALHDKKKSSGLFTNLVGESLHNDES